jgi:hypothetical protein
VHSTHVHTIHCGLGIAYVLCLFTNARQPFFVITAGISYYRSLTNVLNSTMESSPLEYKVYSGHEIIKTIGIISKTPSLVCHAWVY